MTNTEKICLILSTLDVGRPQKLWQLLNSLDPTDLLWNDYSACEGIVVTLFGETINAKIKYSLNDKFFSLTLDDLSSKGITPLTYYSQGYPETLKEIYDPPVTLFCKGNTDLLNKDCFSIVGSRKISSYGRRVTSKFASSLAKQFVIVSGLAYGVDTVAHSSTLDVKGKTIAILGSGLLNIYPATNEGLSRSIVENGGLLVSEFTSFAEPTNYHFPMRNRIVSGLSKGILITEAGAKSGTFSTLEYALDQGKDVFVVPGEIYSSSSKGSNEILKNMQGALVTSPDDILKHYNFSSKNTQKCEIQLDYQEQSVVDLLDNGKMHFDEILKTAKISPSDLNYTLAELELKGLIEKLPGNYYKYNKE